MSSPDPTQPENVPPNQPPWSAPAGTPLDRPPLDDAITTTPDARDAGIDIGYPDERRPSLFPLPRKPHPIIIWLSLLCVLLFVDACLIFVAVWQPTIWRLLFLCVLVVVDAFSIYVAIWQPTIWWALLWMLGFVIVAQGAGIVITLACFASPQLLLSPNRDALLKQMSDPKSMSNSPEIANMMWPGLLVYRTDYHRLRLGRPAPRGWAGLAAAGALRCRACRIWCSYCWRCRRSCCSARV